MHTLIIMLFIIVWIGAIPGWRRVRRGDYRRLFWPDFALDFAIITIAIFTGNLVVVVVTQIIISMIYGAISNKRFKVLFDVVDKQRDKNNT